MLGHCFLAALMFGCVGGSLPLKRDTNLLAKNITAILNGLLENYNNTFRPGLWGPPVEVSVNIDVLSIGPISEKDMQLSMDCYFRQSWVDERLKFSGPLNKLSLNAAKFVSTIWRPDTYIKNGRASYLHHITVPNKLLRLTNTGEVFISQRLTIQVHCPMHLKKFPMDTQACPLVIASLGYGKDDVTYKWTALRVNNKVQMAQYKLITTMIATREVPHQVLENENSTVLLAHLKMERQQGFYILQIYVPCMMIVALSWVSFWINKDASPARVSLGVMTVLSMCAIGLTVRNDLPRVSYSTALDIYLILCFGFVFIALIEYAVINYANRKYWKTKNREGQASRVLATSFKALLGGGMRPPERDTSSGTSSNILSPPSPGWPMMADMSGGSTVGRGLHERVKKPQRMDLAALVKRSVHDMMVANMVNQQQMGASSIAGYDDENEVHEMPQRDSLFGGPQGSSKANIRSMLKVQPHTIVDYIDDVSKVVIPLLYSVLNGFYWASYLYWMEDEVDEELLGLYNRTGPAVKTA